MKKQKYLNIGQKQNRNGFFMNNLEEPRIAFKVLAAGAIKPEDGFRYAYEHGADFSRMIVKDNYANVCVY